MNITRSLAARTLRLASAAVLSFGSLTANARPGGQDANATLITFSANEALKAEDAAKILTDRLDLRSGMDELQSAYTERPGNGLQIQRFSQYFKGIKVAHGTYVLASKNGIAAYAFGKYYNIDAATSTTPVLSEAVALEKALQSTHAGKYMWEVDKSVSLPKGALQFVEDFSGGEADGHPHLAYVFDIYAAEPLSRDKVYVDAQTGSILLRDAILKHVSAKGKSLYSDTVNFEATLSGSKYVLQDYTRGSGVVTYNLNHGTNTAYYLQDTSLTTTFATDAALDAHWGAEKVYDYWKNTHNRLSWNGSNGILKSFVHYGNNYANAMWNGSEMIYGDGTGSYGAFTALDICGHEIGHGVCQSTAGLIYYSEAGGLNEGFSDIWGAVIENYGNPYETDAVSKKMWLIGEEIGVTLRNMGNPKQFGQPDTYQGINWIYTGSGCDNNNDHCGVHTTSGVLNYWFYLLTAGGKGTNDNGDNYHVAGIGVNKAAAIAYATELSLNNTANYAGTRAASIAAATTLYGACSPEVEAVTRAWYAVGLGSNYTPCTTQVSFGATAIAIDEDAAANDCKPARTVNLPIVLNGPAPANGSAVVTVTPVGGTAIAGVDYALSSNTATFPAGSSLPQNVSVTVYDNGYFAPNKYVDFALSLAPNGSTVIKANIMDTIRVTISSDDNAPFAGATQARNIGSGASTTSASSPFMSGGVSGRGQYIYTASELNAAGIHAGAPISSIAFNVTRKYSAQPFSNYTVKMGHVSQNTFTGSFLSSSFTTVYSGTLTTNTGWNTITCSTPFLWDGVSNVVVEVCFSNTSAGSSNDVVAASGGGAYAATATSYGTNGCSLSLSPSSISYYRPLLRLIQDVPPTGIATNVNDSRSWNVGANQTVYFYTQPQNNIIAAVLAAHNDLNCVTAKVTAAGNGFVTASGGKLRSLKEFNLSKAGAASNDTFDVVLYLKDSEIGGQDVNALWIVQTTSADDYNLLPTNTNIIMPSEVIYGSNWTGFRATVTGMGRFYLTNGQLALGVSSVKGKNDALWTGANPFQDAPVLFWNLTSQERVSIRLTDITGKTVYSTDRLLDAGMHSFALNAGTDYAPGTYILQVIRPEGVFTRQLVKQ